MDYKYLSNLYAERKRQLGMSEAHIAMRAKVSQPTVHRILSGRHEQATLRDLNAVAKALGVKFVRTPHGFNIDMRDISEMLEHQAEMLAIIISETVQGTSQLEAQGISADEKKRLRMQTKAKLLAGPKSKLWLEQ